jgi:ubiquinone/menaquinone biosynthesis C-methylase UbiE
LSDISPKFMGMLHERFSAELTRSRKVDSILFDANFIPFCDDSFNVVLGNSVLHHFATFESTLESVYRVLKPGGVAIFGEPVMDTYVFGSMAANMIFEFCSRVRDHPLTEYDLKIVKAIST